MFMRMCDVYLRVYTLIRLIFISAYDARERQQWINKIRMISEMHSTQLVSVSEMSTSSIFKSGRSVSG